MRLLYLYFYIKDVTYIIQFSNSFARPRVKCPKNLMLFLLNYSLFNSFFMYKTLTQTKQDKCKKFLHEIARGRIMEQGDAADSSNDSVPSEMRSAPRGPSVDPPERLLVDFSKNKSRKMVCAGQGKANNMKGDVGFAHK
jgi:hypothetical protein